MSWIEILKIFRKEKLILCKVVSENFSDLLYLYYKDGKQHDRYGSSHNDLVQNNTEEKFYCVHYSGCYSSNFANSLERFKELFPNGNQALKETLVNNVVSKVEIINL